MMRVDCFHAWIYALAVHTHLCASTQASPPLHPLSRPPQAHHSALSRRERRFGKFHFYASAWCSTANVGNETARPPAKNGPPAGSARDPWSTAATARASRQAARTVLHSPARPAGAGAAWLMSAGARQPCCTGALGGSHVSRYRIWPRAWPSRNSSLRTCLSEHVGRTFQGCA